MIEYNHTSRGEITLRLQYHNIENAHEGKRMGDSKKSYVSNKKKLEDLNTRQGDFVIVVSHYVTVASGTQKNAGLREILYKA